MLSDNHLITKVSNICNQHYMPKLMIGQNSKFFKVSFGKQKFFRFCKVRNHSSMLYFEPNTLTTLYGHTD